MTETKFDLWPSLNLWYKNLHLIINAYICLQSFVNTNNKPANFL